MLRVLVTGASGLLGGRLAELLSAHATVVCARHEGPTPSGFPTVPLDLTHPGTSAAAIDAARPDAIVHAAALANADACERDPARATLLNHDAPGALARVCREHGIRLVHLSTDLVFAGDHAPVFEDERPRPLQAYGRSKLAGEDAVRAEHPGAAVFRVALVHGRGFGARSTATEGVRWALAAGRRLRLFTDQFRTTVDPESVADAAWRAIDGGHAGTFHVGGPDRLSRHDLGVRVAEAFSLPVDLIEQALQRDVPADAARPADVSLDCSRTRRILGWAPRPFGCSLLESRVSSEA